jgi:hypothetical protein
MKFPYSSIISQAPGGEEFFVIRRPEIPVTIESPIGRLTVIGLVDTGSDNTIFPKSVADHLQIPIATTNGPAASVFGGQRVQLLEGEVTLTLEMEDGPRSRWTAMVCFYEFSTSEEECVILGHSGFLEFFTATFDGKLAELTLEPNDFGSVQ